MEQEDYKQLIKVAADNVNQAIQTHSFNIKNFFQQMEGEFNRLGFREKSAKVGVDNILLLRFDAVGDFVLTSAAIREVRMNYPYAFITLVVSKVVYPLAERCPYVNEVLIFKPTQSNNPIDEVVNAVNFASLNLWKRRYNLCFSFRYWMDNNTWLIAYLSGAVERVGYSMTANGIYFGRNPRQEKTATDFAFTHSVVQPKKIVHDVARTLYLLESYGLKICRTDLEVWIDKTDLRKAEKILEGFAPNRLKIAVGIGGGHPARHYPIEKYLVAFKKLIESGAAIVILGGPSESEEAKFLEENLPKEFVKNIVTINPTWRVTAAITSKLDMYVGNDTGTQHVAAALKKPIVELSPEAKDRETIFERGLSQPSQYYPWQTLTIVLQPEHPMGECAKKVQYAGCQTKSHCIAQITPEEIINAVNEIFYFMKFSKIQSISCPPLIKSMDQESPLYFGFEFN